MMVLIIDQQIQSGEMLEWNYEWFPPFRGRPELDEVVAVLDWLSAGILHIWGLRIVAVRVLERKEGKC